MVEPGSKSKVALFLPSHRVTMPYLWAYLFEALDSRIPMYILTAKPQDPGLRLMVNLLRGRLTVYVQEVPPGYHNAFQTAWRIAEVEGYEKVIWLEDDIYVPHPIGPGLDYGIHFRATVNPNRTTFEDAYRHVGLVVFRREELLKPASMDLTRFDNLREAIEDRIPPARQPIGCYHLTSEEIGSSFDYTHFGEEGNKLWH